MSKISPKGTKRVTITLPKELVQQFKAKSEETGVPMSGAVRRLVQYWVAAGKFPEIPPEKKE